MVFSLAQAGRFASHAIDHDAAAVGGFLKYILMVVALVHARQFNGLVNMGAYAHGNEIFKDGFNN